MAHTIKAVQWNIGGGKIRQEGKDPHDSASYQFDGLKDIIALLKDVDPDVITLQETHANGDEDQVAIIAQALGLPYYISDFYAESHLEEGQKLGQGIVSRFPISNHGFELLHNPNYETVWEDGSKAVSHDKGITSCVINNGDMQLAVKTLHLIPFKRFRVDPLSGAAMNIIADVQTRLRDDSTHLLIQGDFNLNLSGLRNTLPDLFDNRTEEVVQQGPTRATGRKLDHVIFRGLKLLDTETINEVLTDHYPIVTRFKY